MTELLIGIGAGREQGAGAAEQAPAKFRHLQQLEWVTARSGAMCNGPPGRLMPGRIRGRRHLQCVLVADGAAEIRVARRRSGISTSMRTATRGLARISPPPLTSPA